MPVGIRPINGIASGPVGGVVTAWGAGKTLSPPLVGIPVGVGAAAPGAAVGDGVAVGPITTGVGVRAAATGPF